MYHVQNPAGNISRSPERLPALQVIQTNGTEMFGRSGSGGSPVPVKAEKKIMGAFHSTKTSGLNFGQFPVANGTAFSKKEDNLAVCTQILENFARSVSSTET